jgi:hypothetical protein
MELNMRRLLRVRGLGLLVLTALVSCVPAVRGYGGNGVALFVANDGAGPVTMIVERDGETLDLGPVQRFEYRRIKLADVASGTWSTLRVRITPADTAGSSAGTSEFATDTIRARAGTVVDVRLRWPLHQSTWVRY